MLIAHGIDRRKPLAEQGLQAIDDRRGQWPVHCL
jgi:hypothetical protein